MTSIIRTVQYGCVGLLFFGLSACSINEVASRADASAIGAFASDYAIARSALEAGDYELAQNKYASLLAEGTPLDARLRLEYAHALLRANDFEDAAKQAKRAAGRSDGVLRAANQAVQATAEHEMAFSESDPKQSRALLKSSHNAMKQALRHHREIDPEGTLRERLAEIETLLEKG